MPRRQRLLPTEETVDRIVAGVLAGGWPWTAAVAAGVSRGTFARWMVWGRVFKEGRDDGLEDAEAWARNPPFIMYPEDDVHDLYCELYSRVSRATAEARLIAERTIFINEPFRWLRYGPGRDTADDPGWGERLEVRTVHEGEPMIAQVQVVNYRAALAPLAPTDDDS